MLFYPAALPLSTTTLTRVTALIRTHHKIIDSRWRALDPGAQALLTLAYLRKGERFADLAAGLGISAATAWRRTRETIAMLEVADSAEPPLRVLFRAAAPTVVRDVYEKRLAEWAAWEGLAIRAHGRADTEGDR
ncbi:helix-turn-helix domain-containing protein [Glycomyces tenuis]|uniref:helix-turn-helix domain-containing protein n=1 Tax=Glycomyces tenuis TaxID=58116 RepID=UPI00138ABE63